MGGGSDLDSSLGSDDSDIDIADDFRSDEDETIAKLTGDGPIKTKPIDLSDEDF